MMLQLHEPAKAPAMQMAEDRGEVDLARAMAFLLVEQRIDVALELSSRCLVMDRGRFVHESDSAVLRRNPERVGDLLGLQHAA
jgi:branched-chain amino acid transport system ATP-binding protein